MASLGYISEVQLPGVEGTYTIKDVWAREQIETLSGYTEYLGVTTTALTDGVTTNPITIGGKSITAKKGDIANYGSKEFIWNGTAWQEFGDMSGLGALAYKDSATGSITPNVNKTGTISVNNKTLSATTIPVKLSTTAVTGATSFKAVNTPSSGKAAVTVSYSKATGGTATVNSSATFTGTLASMVTGVTGGTGTKNTAATLSLSEVTSDGTTVVTAIPSTATATNGAATVGSKTVYGLAASTTKYMTGAETLSATTATALTSVTATTNANNFSASVVDEVLTFAAAAGTVTTTTAGSAVVLSSGTSITAGTDATATSYTVGKNGATTFTQPTITIGAATTKQYKVAVPANTYITNVAAAEATYGDVTVTVSGSAVTNSAVTITNTSANATGTTDNNVITGLTTSTFYGTVSAYAGGDHNHDVTDTISIAGAATSVTVS